MGPRPIESEAQKALVRRHRREHGCTARKGDQSDIIVIEIRKQIGNLGLRTFESRGLRIVCQHRARNIERDHDLCTDTRRRHETRSPLRLHEGHDHRKPGQPEQRDARPTPPAGGTVDQPIPQRGTHQAIERAVTASLEQDQRQHGARPDPKRMHEFGVHEMYG